MTGWLTRRTFPADGAETWTARPRLRGGLRALHSPPRPPGPGRVLAALAQPRRARPRDSDPRC
jgi:hypothetical protein